MGMDDKVAAAQKILGPERIKAAGLFALQDNYKAMTVGAVGGGMAGGSSVAGNAVGAGLGNFAARQANAEEHGVTEQMMLAVTDERIHVLAMPAIGGVPERELMSFDRSNTDVKVKNFGLSKRIHLQDRGSGLELGIQGTTARFGYGGKGDKAVLDELQS